MKKLIEIDFYCFGNKIDSAKCFSNECIYDLKKKTRISLKKKGIVAYDFSLYFNSIELEENENKIIEEINFCENNNQINLNLTNFSMKITIEFETTSEKKLILNVNSNIKVKEIKEKGKEFFKLSDDEIFELFSKENLLLEEENLLIFYFLVKNIIFKIELYFFFFL